MLIRKEQDDRKRRLTNFQAACILLFFAVSACLFVFTVWRGVSAYLEYEHRSHAYDTLILETAHRNGLDPALLKAVIWKESRFRREMIGSKGEIGLMQIMPQFAVKDWADAHKKPVPSRGALADPQLNIEIGSWFLARAMRRWKKYKDCTALALCEYNAGYLRANEWKPGKTDDPVQERIKISSTAQYVRDILGRVPKYDQEFRQMKTAKRPSGKK